MSQAAAAPRPKSNSYTIFIFVLTIISLVVMVVMLLPGINDETVKVLSFYDNLICVIFPDRLFQQPVELTQEI